VPAGIESQRAELTPHLTELEHGGQP
jgi:hypothetical protein